MKRAGSRLLRPLLFLVVVAATLACARQPARVVVFDLAAGLPLADVRQEVDRIDLGQHDNRWHLGSGWTSEVWHRRKNTMYVAAGADEATLRFRMAEPAESTIRLLGQPLSDFERGEARFELLLNGVGVGEVAVEVGQKPYAFRAQAEQLRAGTNEVTIRWLVEGDERPAMAWFELDIERQRSDEELAPRQLADKTSLLLPPRARLDYYLRVPDDAMLGLREVSLAGGPGGALEVSVAEDGSAPLTLARIEPSGRTRRIGLEAYSGRVVQLSLEAVPSGDAPAGFSGLVVAGPAVLAPAQPDAQVETVAEAASRRPPNVLIYVVDTLRADHLGLYGYDRPVSPELDRFAADATVFDDTIGQSSWTRASMASVFTGLWPVKHAANGRKDILAPEAVTMAEVLQAAGYETIAIVENRNVFPVFGFDQGFDHFTRMIHGNGAKVTNSFVSWLDVRTDERPFFAWLHPVDPHDPYVPLPEFRQQFYDLEGEPFDLTGPPDHIVAAEWPQEKMDLAARHLMDLYDAEIATNDRAFGALVAGLGERGLLDNTLLVFLSDHGEEFLEHGGWTHGHNLHAETLNVPLVIRFPDRGDSEGVGPDERFGRGVRVEETVQHIDVLPTVLDYLGLEAPPVVEGRSLLGLIENDGDKPGIAVPAFSFVFLEGKPHLGVVDGDWKLIQRLVSREGVITALFNRSSDPLETENLVLANPIRTRFLELLLDARVNEGSLLTTSEAELDEETEQALRALGYLQ